MFAFSNAYESMTDLINDTFVCGVVDTPRLGAGTCPRSVVLVLRYSLRATTGIATCMIGLLSDDVCWKKKANPPLFPCLIGGPAVLFYLHCACTRVPLNLTDIVLFLLRQNRKYGQCSPVKFLKPASKTEKWGTGSLKKLGWFVENPD